MIKIFIIVLCLIGLFACQNPNKQKINESQTKKDTTPPICKGIYIKCESLTIKLDSTIEPDTHYRRLLTRYFEITLLDRDCNPKNAEDSTCLEDFITQNKSLFDRPSFFTASLCLILDHYEPKNCDRASINSFTPYWVCPNTDVLIRITDTLLAQGHSLGIVALWDKFDERKLKHFIPYRDRVLQKNDLDKMYFVEDMIAVYHNQQNYSERDQYLKHLKEVCQYQNDLAEFKKMQELIKEPFIDAHDHMGY